MQKIIFTLIILLFAGTFSAFAQSDSMCIKTDTIRAKDLLQQVDVEVEMGKMLLEMMNKQHEDLARKQDSIHNLRLHTDLTTLQPFHIGYADSLKMQEKIKQLHGVHPLTIELVFMPISLNMNWKYADFSTLYFGAKALKPKQKNIVQLSFVADTIAENLNQAARNYITTHAAHLYVSTFQQLPDIKHLTSKEYLTKSSLGTIAVAEKTIFDEQAQEQRRKMREIKAQHSKWQKNGDFKLLFSQNFVSQNWYKGGHSSFAVLGVVSGNINYDNKKNIKWENYGEWRAGFQSIASDTLHKISTNDDLFKLYTKLGVKAFKHFYYSAAAEFKTQLFDTYKGTNSDTLVTAFFTPMRFNLSLGLDYQPNKNLSIMVSPLSYKFVYVRDTVRIEQTNFSVPTDKKSLSELGSSVRIEWTYKPIREINLVSKFYFYTNYKKVEIDWEIGCDFMATRFLTMHVMLHPRYDNTVITPNDEKARVQFKELVSLGLAYHI